MAKRYGKLEGQTRLYMLRHSLAVYLVWYRLDLQRVQQLFRTFEFDYDTDRLTV
jgi:site-specific recombinase XerD